MTFWKLVLTCMSKKPNLAEIYKFGGKSFKKLNSLEFIEFVFSKSGWEVDGQGIWRKDGQECWQKIEAIIQ